MSAQNNELVFRKLIEEGFNKGNLDALDDLFTAISSNTRMGSYRQT